MSKKLLCLLLEPDEELKFRPPFTANSSSTLKLTNLFDFPVCFKVQTTSPESYFVRPKCGLLEPTESLDVNIKLRSAEFDFLRAKPARFKILVYKAEPGVSEVAQWLESAKRETIAEPKIRCIFENSPVAPAVEEELDLTDEDEPSDSDDTGGIVRTYSEPDTQGVDLPEEPGPHEECPDGKGDSADKPEAPPISTDKPLPVEKLLPLEEIIPRESGYRSIGYFLVAAFAVVGGVLIANYCLTP